MQDHRPRQLQRPVRSLTRDSLSVGVLKVTASFCETNFKAMCITVSGLQRISETPEWQGTIICVHFA